MSDDIKAPTCAEISEGWEDAGIEHGDTFERVHSNADPSWRHGCYMSDVFRRAADDTFWLVAYRLSGDGETNELRQGFGTVVRVYPQTKTVTEYVVTRKED